MFGKCSKCGSSVGATTSGDYICYNCGNIGNNIKNNNSYNRTTNIRLQKQQEGLGWICPKCGSVMSPYQSYCVKCTKFEITC